ncbi:MAG: efflux RND transporter periplasmic adaptor subunit [Pseudomonadota bacterium]
MRLCYRSFLLIGFLSVSGCGPTDSTSPAPSAPEPLPSPDARGNPRRTVSLRAESLPYITVQEIHPEAFAGTISAPARVDFRTKAISTAGTVVAGRVTKIHVQIGDRIKAGDPLATLVSGDAAQMRSDFARAEAELARADDRLRRQRQMERAGVGLEVERMEAETEFKQARTEFERSRDFLKLLGEGTAGEVTVRAPMDSMVLRADVSVGASVGSGAPLFELGEPAAAWIVADVFEKDLLLVEKGAKAVIELASLPNAIHGHVVGESAAIQTEFRRGSVFIEPDDPRTPLKPGMYARVTIEASAPSRIILPTTAILIRDGKETVVYVEVSPGTFEARSVQVGQSREGMTPVLQGLAGGERVVVKGALLLDGEAAMLL